MSDPEYVREFKAHSKGSPSMKDLTATEEELYGASDRAIAIVLATFVEATISRFIQIHLRPDLNSQDRDNLFGFDGPVGTFSSKIALAYAMNFFGPVTQRELGLIRLIRNGFAHSEKHIRFEDGPTAAMCAQLKLPDTPGAKIPTRGFTRSAEPNWTEFSDMTKAQNRYRSSVHTISSKLLTERSRIKALQFIKKKVQAPVLP